MESRRNYLISEHAHMLTSRLAVQPFYTNPLLSCFLLPAAAQLQSIRLWNSSFLFFSLSSFPSAALVIVPQGSSIIDSRPRL